MNAASIFPKGLSPLLTNGAKVYGAWTTEKQITAAALLLPPIDGSEEYCLMDLCVERAFRGKGIARATLQNLAATLVKEGKRSLRVRCMGEMNQVTEIYEFFVTSGFLPCLLTGRMLSWQLTDWLDSPLAEQMKETPVPVTNVCDAMALPENMRMKLTRRAGAFDPQLSRFYFAGEKLAGAVFVKRADEHTVIVYRTHLAEQVPFRKVYVPMLASLFQELRRTLAEDDVISVISSDAQETNALRKMFDEPDSETFVQEYVRVFSDQEPETGCVVSGEPDLLSFGWITEETDLAELSEHADFSGVWALYEQEDPKVEAYLKQKEFLLPEKKVTDEPSLRKELNEWLTLLRRDPLPPEKQLPFAAFREQLGKAFDTNKGSEEQLSLEKEQEPAPVSAEQLNYFVFSQDDGMLEQVLPDFLRRNKREHVVLGARDEGGVLYAFASFYRQPFPQKTLMLEYLFVSGKQRGRGIGSQLLRFAKKVFSEAGMRGITTKQAGKGEKLLRTHEFLKRAGFAPLTLSAKTVIYYLQDLCESRMMEMPPEQRRQLPKVEQIEDRDDFRVIEFAKECREHGFVFEHSRYDTEFTFFYIEGARIRGVISMEQCTGNLLMMLDTYIARDCKTRYVQPALLLAALDEAKKRMRDDAMLILQLYDGWNLESLETLIGQGDSTLQMCEYVMPFL